MTEGVLGSQGTKIYFSGGLVTGSSTSEAEILKVACPTAVDGIGGGASNQIDKTCLDSISMEFKKGLENPSPMNIPINFIPRSRAHQRLLALKASGEEVDFMVVFSDQEDAPTAFDSDGRLVSPGPTSARFRGYVADAPIAAATNDIARGQLSIQRSGPTDWDLPEADLD